MPTRLGLISDVHASPEPLAAALDLLREQGAERVICAGDIAGYGDALEATVDLLVASGCDAICGNHDRWHLEQARGAPPGPVERYLAALPRTLDLTVDGCRVHVVHASPPGSLMDGIRLLDEDGDLLEAQRQAWSERLAAFDHDLLIVGHTHQLFAERLGTTLVVNPGSTLFNRSCALVELPSLVTRLLPLPGEQARRACSWRGGWK
jgi:putative phosphoesterase